MRRDSRAILSRSNFARPGSPDPGQRRGFGNPLRAISDSRILVAILALTLSLSLVTGVEAEPPPLPSSFYGAAKLDGANVSDGTIVSAWIRGVKYAETQTLTYQGDSVCAIRVPGDDLGTPEVEGGVEGDTIIFKVGEAAATQTGTWHGGTDVEFNLTACSLFGDLNCSCLVDVADIMKVANCWRCKCWDSCYDPRYDIDDDCDIDVVDIMLVVAVWGSTCP